MKNNKKLSFLKTLIITFLVGLQIIPAGCTSKSANQPSTPAPVQSTADAAENVTETKAEEEKKPEWKEENGVNKHYDADGKLSEGWVTDDSGKYYCSAGVPKTGWNDIEGKKYHFNIKGIMDKGITLDGYTIDNDGVATKQEEKQENKDQNKQTASNENKKSDNESRSESDKKQNNNKNNNNQNSSKKSAPNKNTTVESVPSKGETVYVASSGNGKCYHRNSHCSNMKGANAMSRSAAESRGLRPCKKCY